MEHVQRKYLEAKDKIRQCKKKKKNNIQREEKVLNQTTWYFVSILSFFPVSFPIPIYEEEFQKKACSWSWVRPFAFGPRVLRKPLGTIFSYTDLTSSKWQIFLYPVIVYVYFLSLSLQ